MSQRLRRNVDLLSLLARAKPHMIKAVVKAADKEAVCCLCECAKNILNGNVPLNKSHLCKLKRYKADVRQLVNKRLSVAKKKKILQKGGFLSALLAPVAANLLAPLVEKILKV